MLHIAIAAAYFVYDPDLLAGIEPPKTFMVGAIFGAALLERIVRGGWSAVLTALRITWRDGDAWQRAGLAATGAFLTIIVVSTATSIVPRSSLLGTLSRGQGTLFTLVGVGAVIAQWPSLRSGADTRPIVRAIAVSGVLPAVVAIGQAAGYDLVFGGPSISDRPAGTFGNAVILATLLAAAAIAAVAMAHEAWQSRAVAVSRRGWHALVRSSFTTATIGTVVAVAARIIGIAIPDAGWIVVPLSALAATLVTDTETFGGRAPRRHRTVLWAAVAFTCLLGLGASGSRGAMVGVGVGVAIWAWPTITAHDPTRKRPAILASAAIVSLVAVTATFVTPIIGRVAAADASMAWRVIVSQADTLGRDTLTTRLGAWRTGIDAYRTGQPALGRVTQCGGPTAPTACPDSRLVVAMASSGHQEPDRQTVESAAGEASPPSLLRRALGFGPEAQVILLGTDATGHSFDRAHNASLDILLTTGALGLAMATLAAVAIAVVAVRRAFQADATDADRAAPAILAAIGVASLTGVDSTAQATVVMLLVATILARSRGHAPVLAPPDGRELSTHLIDVTVILTVGALGAWMAASGEVAASPYLWTIIGGSVAMASCRSVPTQQVGMRWWVAPTVVGLAIAVAMLPAWRALAAGAEARTATRPGISFDERQRRLDSAVAHDPNQATYRQLRGP